MKLAHPKLTLYAFHLRNDLSIGDDKPVDNANHLWDKCEELGKIIGAEELQNFSDKLKKYNPVKNDEIGVPPTQDYPEKDYLELLPERLLYFSGQSNNPQLTGEVYPLQIDDTFAVDITLRYANQTVDIEKLTGLNPDGFLLPDNCNSFLGQTLILFAEPEENITNDLESAQELAKKCFQSLLPKEQIEKFSCKSGRFFDSPIFEYDNDREKPSKIIHILIWFNCFPVTETKENEGKYYDYLIRLLCHRSKILFAYSESRWCSQEAKNLYQKLKSYVDKFDEERQTKKQDKQDIQKNIDKRLENLKKLLIEISQDAFNYTRHLRDMEIHRATIKTNATNYKLFLNKLKLISINDRDKQEDNDDLKFLEDLLTFADNKLIPQIQGDLDYLNAGKDLYGEMINSIRGFIAIIQTESDRTFQIWLTCIGSGLAVSGVSSQVINQPITTYLSKSTTQPTTDNTKPHIPYLFLDGLFHIGLGIIVGTVAGCIARK